MTESSVLVEIEMACMAYKICVLPRNPKTLACSVWSMPDPLHHSGVVRRVNTGALKAGNRFIRFGLPGIPDFEGWRFSDGRTLAIEAKSATGTLSPDQRAYAALAARTGVLVGLARSYDECAMLLETWGFEKP